MFQTRHLLALAAGMAVAGLLLSAVARDAAPKSSGTPAKTARREPAEIRLDPLAGKAPRKAPPAPKKESESGLAVHYYRDPANWDGHWPDGAFPNFGKPDADPNEWTFSRFDHTRVESHINHAFIKRGWFSARWKGSLDTHPAGDKGEPALYKFEIWADDGCRLFLDGKKLIDSWRDCDEDSPESRREGQAFLVPGKHAITVEYFQGQSLPTKDRDPMKLSWECPARHIPRQIIPASHFSHSAMDLAPEPGRLDPKEKPEEKNEKPNGKGKDAGDTAG
ncbi:MAG: PA14 domain-containing protein [Planctomycetota bacterium]